MNFPGNLSPENTPSMDPEKSLAMVVDDPWIFGIRHHSPACARMLVAAAAELKPQAIAVEMPADLQPLLQWLAHPETIAPVAIAAAAAEHHGLYPFADFSPELAIMRWARAAKVPVHFIDLPMGNNLRMSATDTEADPSNPTDPMVDFSQLIGQEAWDTNVEARAVGQPWSAIRRAALAVGVGARLAEGPDAITKQREAYRRHSVPQLPENTMVVVGSYHCLALMEQTVAVEFPEPRAVTASLVPYSYQQIDTRSGYGSGIRDPYWHQCVFNATAEQVREMTTGLLVDVAKQLRLLGHPAGTGEIAEANRMALDLATLRGLGAPGRREFLDAVTTVFAHGEIMGKGRAIAQALQTVLVGDKQGHAASDAPVPALLTETIAELQALKLPANYKNATARLRVDPFSGRTGLQRHLLLERFKVLGISYETERTQGQNRGQSARSYTVSCTWTRSTQTDLSLAAARGVNVEQATSNTIIATLNRSELTATQVTTALSSAICCGIDRAVTVALDLLEQFFIAELSLSAALEVAETLAGVTATREAGAQQLTKATAKRCQQLVGELEAVIVAGIESVAGSTDPADARALGRIVSLKVHCPTSIDHQIARLKLAGSPLMQGAALALQPEDTTAATVSSWTDRAARPRLVGFLAALGPLWPDSELLEGLITQVESQSDSAFVASLPSLRASFDIATAGEKEAFLDRLSARLDIQADVELPPEVLMKNAEADQKAREQLELLGLLDLSFSPATRWRLILGAQPEQLNGTAHEMARTLDELYGATGDGEQSAVDGSSDGRVRAGHQPGTITTRKWSEDIEALFGATELQEILGEATERGRSDAVLMLDAEAVRPSVQTLQTILNLKGALPEARLKQLRPVVDKIVSELSRDLASQLAPAFSQMVTTKLTGRKTPQLSLPATIRANLKNVVEYQSRPTVVPVHPKFFDTGTKISPWHIIVVVDVSGSMEPSTIYAAMTAAIMAQVRTLQVSFITFDTEVVDLSDHAHDPLSLLLEISVGGGTNIGRGLRYAESLITNPTRTAVVLITDFEEGGPLSNLLATVRRLNDSGVKLIGCAALNDEGKAAYEANTARLVAAAGMRVASLSPLQLAQWVGEVLR